MPITKTICVKAAPLADLALKGQARVVREGTRARYIDEMTAATVPFSAYYARKLARGELVLVNQSPSLAEIRTSARGEDDLR